MMARWLCTALVSSLIFGSGCCCSPCGPFGPRGGSCCLCLPCLPPPIVWNGCCNECGPHGQSCGEMCGTCGGCGLFSWLNGGWTCRRGCGEVYINEWISDPPDCCDPCDRCNGQFTGPCGNCCLGPAQRVLAALHGYSYCPRPYCGPWRPIFGHCNPCGPVCGCGNAGCASCGGEMAHGADIYYEGSGNPSPKLAPAPPAPKGAPSVMDENWDTPRARPEPGRPMHNAQQPPRNQMGRKPSPQATQVSGRQAAPNRATAGTGVRQANYDQ
jgi:hypothetical protein